MMPIARSKYREHNMTVKELQRELSKEKYDTKNTPVYVGSSRQGLPEGRIGIDRVERYDDGVYLIVKTEGE
jgi:hypothetical protein